MFAHLLDLERATLTLHAVSSDSTVSTIANTQQKAQCVILNILNFSEWKKFCFYCAA